MMRIVEDHTERNIALLKKIFGEVNVVRGDDASNYANNEHGTMAGKTLVLFSDNVVLDRMHARLFYALEGDKMNVGRHFTSSENSPLRPNLAFPEHTMKSVELQRLLTANKSQYRTLAQPQVQDTAEKHSEIYDRRMKALGNSARQEPAVKPNPFAPRHPVLEPV